MAYTPLWLVPNTLEDLSLFVNDELRKISAELQKLVLVEYHAAPTNPFHGLRVIADGTNWNPGSGRGVYWYDASDASWNFMG